MKTLSRIAAALILLASPAWADGTIDTLTAAGAIVGTESIPVFQTANPAVKTTPSAIGTYLTSKTNTWSAVQTFNASQLLLGGVTGSIQCLHASATGVVTGTGSDCGAGGGAVSSVSNSDSTLTISPTTGAVIGSLNLAHANTWSAATTFSSTLTFSGLTTGTQVSCLGLTSGNLVALSTGACGSGGGGGITVGSTTVTSGTSGQFLYNNAGVVGNQTAVTSISAGCGASTSGSPITTTGIVSAIETVTIRTSGNYSTGDCGTIVQYNDASDASPTIPTTGSAGAGSYFETCSIQHSQTLTATSGTIGGASTYLLRTGTPALPTCVKLIADATNTNWVVVPIQGATQVFVQPIETAVALSGCNGSTATVDLTKGTYFSCTVTTGAYTIAVSNPAASGLVSSFTLELTNGGSQTPTYMSGIKWPGGTAPTLTASGVDLLVFSTRDAGTTWRGVASEINSH